MSTEENKALVRRLIDAVNQRMPHALNGLIAQEFHLNGQPVGLTNFKEFVTWLPTVLAEADFKIEDLIAEDDKVVARLRRRAIHQGWLGVAPTGKPITTAGIYIFRAADGKLAEAWDAWDELGVLQQIGALPVPGQGAS